MLIVGWRRERQHKTKHKIANKQRSKPKKTKKYTSGAEFFPHASGDLVVCMQRCKQKCLARERRRWCLTTVFDYQRGFIFMTEPGSSQRGSPNAAKEICTGYKEIFLPCRVVVHGNRFCRSPSSANFRTQLSKALSNYI